MNMLKKGPELKLPDVKVPDFVLDLYYDLRERHLLPLVAILLVAIVALPIALSGGSSDAESEENAGATSISTAEPSSKLVVATAAPGLRDYRRRLHDQAAKDPFLQQYTESEGESEGATAVSGSSESASTTVEGSSVTLESTSGEETSTSTETTETVPASNGNGEPANPGQLQYFSFAADVRIVPAPSGAGASKAEPSVRRNLPELTMLPSRDVPALTFMGVTKDKKKALMLVSDKVTGLFGDAICVVGSERCQLLALEQGIPETVVYGADQRNFRIELLKLRLLTTDKLNEAPLSKPKEKKSGGGSKKHSAG
jgi:hypothetical protein